MARHRYMILIVTQLETYREDVTAKDPDEAISLAIERFLDVKNVHLKRVRNEQMEEAQIQWRELVPDVVLDDVA